MAPPAQDDSGGWNASAEAWIRFVDEGDSNRTHLLDPLMLDWCGDVRGKDALDIGCGEGRFCRMLRARGARVQGLDPTARLVNEARRRDPAGDYRIGDAAQLPFADQTFDLCASYVALVDIADYRKAIAEMARVLRPGGRVVFANLHPLATANLDGWTNDADGNKLHFPLDHYSAERAQIGRWRGIAVLQYHRPLHAILHAFLATGMQLSKILEPIPTADAVREKPILADNLRVPLFFMMEWRK